MKKLTTLIKKAIEMTQPYDVPADHAWSRQSVYDRQNMQHLSAVPDSTAVVAWHTSLDIQATKKADGHTALFLAGREVASHHRNPEQVVVYLCGLSIQAAKRVIHDSWRVSL